VARAAHVVVRLLGAAAQRRIPTGKHKLAISNFTAANFRNAQINKINLKAIDRRRPGNQACGDI
jgi:hypothetical protein